MKLFNEKKKVFSGYSILLIALFLAFACNKKTNLKNYDVVIKNTTIVSMDSNYNIYNNSTICISGNIIDTIITDSSNYDYTATKIIDGKNKLVIPGFVNTHTHTPMTMFRGVADDKPLHDWLYNYIFPIEAKFVNAESVNKGAKLAICEMIRSGITTFTDMYYYEDEVAKASKQIGMRAIVCEGLIGFPVPNSKTYKDGINYIRELHKKYQNDSLITVGVSVHAPYTCDSTLIKEAKSLADELKTVFTIHVAETKWEYDSLIKTFKKTPVEYLNSLHILSNNVVAAHCVHLTDKDIDIFSKNGVAVAHNAQCNMKIISGVAPIWQMSNKNVELSIGTDGVASNNNLNFFEEMNTIAILHKLYNNNPVVLNAKEVVRMATIGGAEALGMKSKIGSIEKGKYADLSIIDLNKSHLTPIYNIYSHIVYSMNASDVQSVIINGKIVMENNKIITIDEQKVIDDINNIATEIKKTLK